MKKPIAIEDVIKLLKDGWELGHSTLSSRANGVYFIQQGGLCKAGTSHEVHSFIVKNMIKSDLIDYAPRQEEDGFWLIRYRLK